MPWADDRLLVLAVVCPECSAAGRPCYCQASSSYAIIRLPVSEEAAMFRVFWLAIKDMFDELLLLIGINLIWLLLNLPLTILAFLLAGLPDQPAGLTTAGLVMLLEVLPLGPSTAGLMTVAQRITEGRTASFSLFFASMRANARWSWQIYGAWMIGLLLILINVRFYAGTTSTIASLLQILFLYLLLIWLALLIYIGPLMILQNDRRLRILARNAFVMALGRPIFTLITLILMVVIIILSAVVPPLGVLITFAFLALWGYRATTKLIKDAEDRRAAREEQAAANASGNSYSTEKGRGGQIRPRD